MSSAFPGQCLCRAGRELHASGAGRGRLKCVHHVSSQVGLAMRQAVESAMQWPAGAGLAHLQKSKVEWVVCGARDEADGTKQQLHGRIDQLPQLLHTRQHELPLLGEAQVSIMLYQAPELHWHGNSPDLTVLKCSDSALAGCIPGCRRERQAGEPIAPAHRLSASSTPAHSQDHILHVRRHSTGQDPRTKLRRM